MSVKLNLCSAGSSVIDNVLNKQLCDFAIKLIFSLKHVPLTKIWNFSFDYTYLLFLSKVQLDTSSNLFREDYLQVFALQSLSLRMKKDILLLSFDLYGYKFYYKFNFAADLRNEFRFSNFFLETLRYSLCNYYHFWLSIKDPLVFQVNLICFYLQD